MSPYISQKTIKLLAICASEAQSKTKLAHSNKTFTRKNILNRDFRENFEEELYRAFPCQICGTKFVYGVYEIEPGVYAQVESRNEFNNRPSQKCNDFEQLSLFDDELIPVGADKGDDELHIFLVYHVEDGIVLNLNLCSRSGSFGKIAIPLIVNDSIEVEVHSEQAMPSFVAISVSKEEENGRT